MRAHQWHFPVVLYEGATYFFDYLVIVKNSAILNTFNKTTLLISKL